MDIADIKMISFTDINVKSTRMGFLNRKSLSRALLLKRIVLFNISRCVRSVYQIPSNLNNIIQNAYLKIQNETVGT